MFVRLIALALFIISFGLIAISLDFAAAESLTSPAPIPLNFSLLPIIADRFDDATSMPTAVSSSTINAPTNTLTPTTTGTAVATNTPTITNTPLPTMTIEPTATNTPMPANTPTSLPPSTTGDVRISKIFYNGYVPRVESDEYVEIKNYDTRIILLSGWQLIDGDGDPSVTLPAYAMQPGEICRVYTNQVHSDWCSFSFAEEGSAIWNNDGDTAYLKNGYGETIDVCNYTGGGDDGAIAICE